MMYVLNYLKESLLYSLYKYNHNTLYLCVLLNNMFCHKFVTKQ